MAQEKNERIVCLFGSGISAPAKIPMTDEITERILPLRDFRRGDDMLFELCEPGEQRPGGLAQRAIRGDEIQEQEGIRTTVNVVVDLINESRHPFDIAQSPLNYEDVVYALDRLWRLESGRAFDPLAAVTRKALLSRLRSRPRLVRDFQEVLSVSIHCMIDLVSKELEVDRPSWAHLQFLSELIDEIGPANVMVLTTNHDTLLDQYVAGNKVRVEDGFTVPADEFDAAQWVPHLLDQEQESVRLLKVHGSVDWHVLMPRDPTRARTIMKRGTVRSLKLWVPPGLWDVDERSVILVGSYNKAARYTAGVFGEIFWRARREIMRTRNVFVCGYGFRDEVINGMLIDWASNTPDGRLIVLVHRGFDQMTEKTDAWMRKWFASLRKQGVLIPIEHTPVQNLTWQDHIRPRLKRSPAN